MNKAIVRDFTHGRLKDGRTFQIRNFKKLCICEDGSIHSGVAEVEIDGKVDDYPISTIAENIDYLSLPSDILC